VCPAQVTALGECKDLVSQMSVRSNAATSAITILDEINFRQRWKLTKLETHYVLETFDSVA